MIKALHAYAQIANTQDPVNAARHHVEEFLNHNDVRPVISSLVKSKWQWHPAQQKVISLVLDNMKRYIHEYKYSKGNLTWSGEILFNILLKLLDTPPRKKPSKRSCPAVWSDESKGSESSSSSVGAASN
jgi:hypothetical protein